MVLPVIIYGASKLRERTFDIDLGVDFKTLAGNMSQTLKKAGGIGLAGPQVSVAKNVAKQIATVGKVFPQVNQRFPIDVFSLRVLKVGYCFTAIRYLLCWVSERPNISVTFISMTCSPTGSLVGIPVRHKWLQNTGFEGLRPSGSVSA